MRQADSNPSKNSSPPFVESGVRFTRLPDLLAILLVVLGSSVIGGWLLHDTALVQLIPGFTSMVFSTACCFALSGLALLGHQSRSRMRQLGGVLATLALLLIASLNAIELSTGLRVAMTLPELHAWMHDNNPHPGQMSEPTTISFLLAGVALLLLRWRPHPRITMIAGALSAAVLLIGSLAVIGYILHLESLYRWYFFSRMALHTAAGMCVLGVALLQLWRTPASTPVSATDIVRFGATALVAVALTASLVSAAWFRNQGDIALQQTLSMTREARAGGLAALLHLRSERATIVTTRLQLRAQLRQLQQHPHDTKALALAHEDVASLMPYGFSSIQLLDGRDQPLLTQGQVMNANLPELALKLGDSGQASLIWHDGFVLRNRLAIIEHGQRIGTAITEQPLPDMMPLLAPSGRNTKGDSIWLCGMQPRGISRCLIIAGKQTVPIAGEAAARLDRSSITDGLPITGKGPQQIESGPVEDTGLRLSIAVGKAEFYAPVRQALGVGLLLMLLVTAAATRLLRARVLPLAQQLASAEGRYAQLVNSLNEGLMLQDAQHHIIASNPALSGILGLTAEQLRQRGGTHPDWRLLNEDGSECPRDQYPSARALRNGVGESNRTIGVHRSDNTIRWLRVSTSLVDDAGSPCVVMLLEDITEHRQALAKAQSAEQRYQMMVASVQDYAIYMLDAEGRVATWNAGAEHMKGYASEEVLGRNFAIFYPDEDRAQNKPAQALLIARTEGRFADQGWRLRKDGVRIWASFTISPVYDEKRVLIGYTGVSRDLTRQRAAEEALQQSEAQYRALLNGIADGVVSVDENGIVHSFSKAAEKIFGHNAKDVVGRNVTVLMPERFRATHDQNVARFALQQDPRIIGLRREVIGLRADGSEFPMMLALNVDSGSKPRYVGLVTDISDRKRADQALAESNALRDLILNMAPYPIISCEPGGIIRYVNPAAERMLLYRADELVNIQTPSIFLDHEEVELQLAELRREFGETSLTPFDAMVYRARHDGISEREWNYVRKDGTRLIGHLTLAAVRDQHGQLNGFVAAVQDISERKRREEYAQHVAHHDFLTGLPNRMLLTDRLRVAAERATRHHEKLSVMMIDLDHFKRVNDSLGHHVGDELLKIVTKRLLACVRGMDTVARLGGDEFIVLIEELHDLADAEHIAQKIVDSVSMPAQVGTHVLHVTPSIGLASFPRDASTPEELIKHADSAMYHAKELGRSRYVVFEPEFENQARQRLALENALRQALVQEEFVLHFQPQMDMRSAQVCGMEALLRWNRPGHGITPPSTFIELAENVGLIVPIGEWVLRTACKQGKRIQEQCGQRLRVAVNLSALQLHHDRLEQVVREALSQSGLAAEDLELEITESMLMEDAAHVLAKLRSLRALGISIAIDDFGVGYSSLSYLSRLAIDAVKIDRSFVDKLPGSESDCAIVNAIFSLASSLGFNIVAEGVEHPAQIDFLRKLKHREICSSRLRLQGFALSPAVPAEIFVAAFGTWNARGLDLRPVELV